MQTFPGFNCEIFDPDILAAMQKAFRRVTADHPYLPPLDVAMRIMAAARAGVLDAEKLTQIAARED